jgi:hypothetical protein
VGDRVSSSNILKALKDRKDRGTRTTKIEKGGYHYGGGPGGGVGGGPGGSHRPGGGPGNNSGNNYPANDKNSKMAGLFSDRLLSQGDDYFKSHMVDAGSPETVDGKEGMQEGLGHNNSQSNEEEKKKVAENTKDSSTKDSNKLVGVSGSERPSGTEQPSGSQAETAAESTSGSGTEAKKEQGEKVDNATLSKIPGPVPIPRAVPSAVPGAVPGASTTTVSTGAVTSSTTSTTTSSRRPSSSTSSATRTVVSGSGTVATTSGGAAAAAVPVPSASRSRATTSRSREPRGDYWGDPLEKVGAGVYKLTAKFGKLYREAVGDQSSEEVLKGGEVSLMKRCVFVGMVVGMAGLKWFGDGQKRGA